MATQEKQTPEKEPVKVTSGKDTAAFVAAKPKAADDAEQAKPTDLGPTDEERAAHAAAMQKLDDDFQARKRQVEEEEKAMIAAAQARVEEMRKIESEALDNLRKQMDAATEEAVARTKAAVADAANQRGADHPTNSRGVPIAVDPATTPIAKMHISELGDGYNGKPDTITN